MRTRKCSDPQAYKATPDSITPERLADYLQSHRKLFVLTGAGCSTESGIPDYRDSDGQWKHSRPIQYQDFVRSDSSRKHYWARSMIGWPRMAAAKPGAAHRALTKLETAGFVHQLVTQNVDGLHQDAGSRRVIDLHGRLATADCLSCGKRVSRVDLQQRLEQSNPALLGRLATTAPDGDAALAASESGDFVVPECTLCGGILKPTVVFFGESVPKGRVERAFERLEEARALLAIGTSLMVYSGYRFCRAARDQGKPIVAINRGRTRADSELAFKVEGGCGEILSQLTTSLGLED
jgi:NAD-dependent SIR2 family protein deacetylase